MLTRGSSAFVVGSHRRIIITYDLDIYKCALQIQQSVVNTNWILQAVFCQSVYCICCPTWPRQTNFGKWHWHMCHWKWYLNFCSSSWKLWWQYIYIYGRHWIPHHNKPSDNDCELDVIIHVALQKYRVETWHWGACSVLYAVARAGDSVLNLMCLPIRWLGRYVLLH